MKLVLEMGARPSRRYPSLVKLAHQMYPPIGEAHLEFSDRRIAKGKLKLRMALCRRWPSGGFQLVDCSTYLPEKQKVVRFGPDRRFYYKVGERKDKQLSRAILRRSVDLPVTGRNTMRPIPWLQLMLPCKEWAKRRFVMVAARWRNRTEWKKASNGADILSDVYNANPTAMRLILKPSRLFLRIQMAEN